MRDVLSCSVTPMLLGNNKCSRRLARRLFWRFSLKSSIFDTHSSGMLDLMLSASFTPIPGLSDDEFILLGLERFACENDDMTLLLVPCSRDFEGFVKRNKRRLEEKFIIRSPREIECATTFGSKMPYKKRNITE